MNYNLRDEETLDTDEDVTLWFSNEIDHIISAMGWCPHLTGDRSVEFPSIQREDERYLSTYQILRKRMKEMIEEANRVFPTLVRARKGIVLLKLQDLQEFAEVSGRLVAVRDDLEEIKKILNEKKTLES